MATILLIDDEEQVRLLFQVALGGAGTVFSPPKMENTACVSWRIRRWI